MKPPISPVMPASAPVSGPGASAAPATARPIPATIDPAKGPTLTGTSSLLITRKYQTITPWVSSAPARAMGAPEGA